MIVRLYQLPVYIQKLIAFAILLLIAFSALNVLMVFASVTNERNEQIVGMRVQLGNLEQIIARAEMVPETNGNTADSKGFLASESAGALKAELQKQIKAFADDNGFSIQSMGGAPDKTSGGLEFVGIRLTGQGTYKSISRFIEAVEVSEPYLIIEQASLRRLQRSQHLLADSEPNLGAQFSIYGGKTGSKIQ